jgi:hypothetical protein
LAPEAVNGPAAATTTEASGVVASPGIKACIDCRHYRLRAKPELFSSADLQTAGGLKARSEWEQQEKQHLQHEEQMVAAGTAFTYEPHHYAWCDAYTRLDLVARATAGEQAALAELMQQRLATMNPVTGELTPVYALCLRMNPTGQCERHEPR